MRKKIAMAFLISFSVCILLACGNTGAAEWENVYYDFYMQKEYGNTIEPRVSTYSEEFLTFGIFDMGQDGVPELIIHDGGASMAEMTNYVFSYQDGAIEFVGELGSRESTMKYAPGSDYYGVFWLSGNNGILDALYYSISDGKLVEEAVLEEELDYDKNLGEDTVRSIRQLTEDDGLYEAYFNPYHS